MSSTPKFHTALSAKDFLLGLGVPEEECSKWKLEYKECEFCGSKHFVELRPCSDSGGGKLVAIPYMACEKCGYIMQNPTFSDNFYRWFYKDFYNIQQQNSIRNKLFKTIDEDGNKTRSYYENAFGRAKYLWEFMKRSFPSFIKNLESSERPALLDIGCGSGGFMGMFQDMGWEVVGNDPQPNSTEVVERYLGKGVRVDNIASEDMQYKELYFDLIVIIGSLEHCIDPNQVLAKCKRYLKPHGMIVVEGRFNPISWTTAYMNSNHQRILRGKQSEAILLKHGFDPAITTTFPVCGEGTCREGGGWVFANNSLISNREPLSIIKDFDLYECPHDMKKYLDDHDYKLAKESNP